MEEIGEHQVSAALPWVKSSDYPMDRRLDEPRVGVDAVEKRNIAFRSLKSNFNSSVAQPVP
jgi:hypothetical protein